MPIKRRANISSAMPSDNVTAQIPRKTLEERTADKRGVFNPKDNPFEGSFLERMGATPTTALTMGLALGTGHAYPAPKQIAVQDLLANIRMPNDTQSGVEATYRNRVKSSLTAIRAFCVHCKENHPAQVTTCEQMSCPLWPFRMGKNRFRGS